jgi:hypothetical protein
MGTAKGDSYQPFLGLAHDRYRAVFWSLKRTIAGSLAEGRPNIRANALRGGRARMLKRPERKHGHTDPKGARITAGQQHGYPTTRDAAIFTVSALRRRADRSSSDISGSRT